ncbi:hypothetical protein [Streptomyces sp. AK04-3B]|uniref:hypothetical protein n=1 Tax=unclassified Streptomyces TaxID=2593676 RepID=UPI0029BC0D09|nr:hypothetical protein [Streptomyces sp. AK04-3B]MDX3798919.1 hypothetical protein [Streptomyces sp. AK04-3B]
MLLLILAVVLLLLVGGCVCVYWEARGDAPRWARGVAKATLVGSELARSTRRSSRSRQSDGDD